MALHHTLTQWLHSVCILFNLMPLLCSKSLYGIAVQVRQFSLLCCLRSVLLVTWEEYSSVSLGRYFHPTSLSSLLPLYWTYQIGWLWKATRSVVNSCPSWIPCVINCGFLQLPMIAVWVMYGLKGDNLFNGENQWKIKSSKERPIDWNVKRCFFCSQMVFRMKAAWWQPGTSDPPERARTQKYVYPK